MVDETLLTKVPTGGLMVDETLLTKVPTGGLGEGGTVDVYDDLWYELERKKELAARDCSTPEMVAMWGREDAAAAVQQAEDDAYDKALFAKQSAEKQAAKEQEASKGEACSTYERDIYA